MTKNQKSHLNCMLAVLVYLDKFTSIFSDAKLIVEMIGTLKGKVELINTIAEEQERNQKGKAINKKQIRDRLIESMLGVGGALRALAVSENDPEMAERVKMRVDQLRNLGPKLAERAEKLHELATERAGDLEGLVLCRT